MSLEDITLGAFAACNSLRIFAYVPQIWKAATDENGASAISYTTWSMFLLAHLSTVAYAIVNRDDWGLAACFALNAACCLAILAVAYGRCRHHAKGPRTLRTHAQVARVASSAQRGRPSAVGLAGYFRWD